MGVALPTHYKIYSTVTHGLASIDLIGTVWRTGFTQCAVLRQTKYAKLDSCGGKHGLYWFSASWCSFRTFWLSFAGQIGTFPFVKIIGHIINIRSNGILDLRHGSVRDDDWEHNEARIGHVDDNRKPAPLALPYQYLLGGGYD